ncbi:MAG: DUF4388 domain-containing protein [Planctomycetes bacterium]|nr:DUF4388 domain-containing protein [Planctomycetota bacterium]
MSFQGDVAGLGLGELLQGLARGGREGSLTLNGGGRCCTIGVAGGQIHLLPEPDEDPEIWRRRCERAWIKDPNHRIDSLRMQEIAYAVRLETLFGLLDCSGVHFRFEQGPLPKAEPQTQTATIADSSEDLRDGARKKLEVHTPVHCPGLSVEFVLLEYARQADEALQFGDSSQLSPDDVVRPLVSEAPSRELERIMAECDGSSTIEEISDRLGWPLRQGRALVQSMVAQSLVRLADARELLALVQHELAAAQFSRASTRLSGWCRHAPPGPPSPGDAELLRAEWQKQRLQSTLAHMRQNDARTLLRRLEFGESEAQAALDRWQEMRKHHKHDTIAELHIVRLDLARGLANGQREMPWGELLKLARNFQDAGAIGRAAVMLRAAADCTPNTNAARLELGTRMLAIGELDEGVPWVLEAAAAFIEQGAADKAVAPLRTLLSVEPENREAKALLNKARARTVRGRLRRKQTLIAAVSLILVATIATVRVQRDRDWERRMAEVTEALDRPEAALALLDGNFADDDSAPVVDLRARLEKTLADRDEDARTRWFDEYHATQNECALGDPLLGLKRALALSTPPVSSRYTEAFPTSAELMESLSSRLAEDVADAATLDEAEASRADQRLRTIVGELRSTVAGHEYETPVVKLLERLDGIETVIVERGETRARTREEREFKERRTLQDQLLAAARAHAAAGDLERAVQAWRKLLATEDGELIRQAFADEIEQAENHWSAVQHARELALAGDHVGARAALEGTCENPGEHLLPWKLASSPSGARVRLPDGSSRVTPFVVESAFGERLHLELDLENHETAALDVDAPADRNVLLSRLPTRRWSTTKRVDAPPVSVGEDHVVASRSGDIARLASDGRMVWAKHINSLGGIARAPVFLARRSGALLVLTEDGDAWILDALTGEFEGPWSAGVPPREGPIATEHGARASFTDGRVVDWTSHVRPESSEPGGNTPLASTAATSGSDAGLAMLRRTSSLGKSLASQWVPWNAEVTGENVIARSNDGRENFSVRWQGQWNYIAWEAPNSKIPRGRLWVSDGAGLRAFEP